MAASAAPISFTFRGTVLNESPFAGYTPGQSVVFTYVLSSPASTLLSDAASGIYNWDDGYMVDPATFLFSSIEATGLEGEWVKTINTASYVMNVEGALPLLAVCAYSIGAPDIGFYAGDLDVVSIFIQGLVDAPFVFDSTPVSLNYFADYLGTYSFAGTGVGTPSSIEFEGNQFVYFDITELTIATIPEPSSVMAFLSGSVAWLLWRRRRG